MAAFGRMEAAFGGCKIMCRQDACPPTGDTVRLFSWGAGFQPARARGKRLVS